MGQDSLVSLPCK